MPDHSIFDDLHTPADLGPALNVAAAVLRLLTVLIGRHRRVTRPSSVRVDRRGRR